MVFGMGTDGSPTQDMVFCEHLRSLSCSHYLPQRRIFTYAARLSQAAPEQAPTAWRIYHAHLATSSNIMKSQLLLD